MNGCKHIQKRIDEADKPDLLPFDVSEHVIQCVECGRFANERSALRDLVAAGTRVSAPINFDARLKARLAEVKAKRSVWWFGSPGYFRLGAATAGLVVIVFAAQYGGLFSDNAPKPAEPPVESAVTIPSPKPSEAAPTPPPNDGIESTSPLLAVKRPNGAPKAGRAQAFIGRAAVEVDFTAEDGGVVLVRGRNGEIDVQMPTVSVGAQPLLYVSAGQRTARNVGASF
jgi:hypothetical protein